MKFTNITLTTTGRAMAETSQQAGEKLEFTRVALGDGDLLPGEDIKKKTALSHERVSLAMQSVTVDANTGEAQVTAYIDNRTIVQGGAFKAREFGLFATNNDGTERLYAYQNVGMDAETVPDLSEPIAARAIVTTSADVSNAANVVALTGVGFGNSTIVSGGVNAEQIAAITAQYQAQLDAAEEEHKRLIAEAKAAHEAAIADLESKITSGEVTHGEMTEAINQAEADYRAALTAALSNYDARFTAGKTAYEIAMAQINTSTENLKSDLQTALARLNAKDKAIDAKLAQLTALIEQYHNITVPPISGGGGDCSSGDDTGDDTGDTDTKVDETITDESAGINAMVLIGTNKQIKATQDAALRKVILVCPETLTEDVAFRVQKQTNGAAWINLGATQYAMSTGARICAWDVGADIAKNDVIRVTAVKGAASLTEATFRLYCQAALQTLTDDDLNDLLGEG